ncbi:MAG: hydantoinase/oxoprolinase family protein [Chloroflexota bacterium]|nr:MAG: hydantoinase/oxoprolinase family protein [Chloroflexota bacterium]
MTIALGIDTGGTYTDAVLIEYELGQVLCSAKALTTRRDLSVGIGEAIDAVLRQRGAPDPSEVRLAALSTTLATNAIVEGQGSPACLVLIGYDPDLIQRYGFEDQLVTDDVVYLAGGHDAHGDEAAPLDEAALLDAVRARQGRVEAFGVSGYFGVRNPAHELRAQELIHELTGLPVTCGHELTTRLNSVRRATTVALNARLVPLLRELIQNLRHTLAQRSIAAPLMVVKGDGSLVRAEWAMLRPIETILSGPAASAVGAWHLACQAGEDLSDGALWSVDVGGTTTDIASLRNGRPGLNPEGAQVGRWRTMVEAVDVHTVGLGGDSHVRVTTDHKLAIGPRRVVPLSLLAQQHPEVIEDLRIQAVDPPRAEVAAQFLQAGRQAQRSLTEAETVILERLASGPISLAALVQQSRYGMLELRRIERLANERLIVQSGFTPTDALHALGGLELWNVEAARLGAQTLATHCQCAAESLCQDVIEGVSRRAARALVSKVLTDEARVPNWEGEPTAALLLEQALSKGYVPSDEQGLCSELACTLVLRRPVVAIGAPAHAYMPRTAEMLHTRLVIPPHAEVANAVGAAVGGVVQRQRVLITPLEDGKTLRLHLPHGVRDFRGLEEAVAYAHNQMVPWMESLARQAGAVQIEVHMERSDAKLRDHVDRQDKLYLDTELTFTAVGRPSPAVREEIGQVSK